MPDHDVGRVAAVGAGDGHQAAASVVQIVLDELAGRQIALGFAPGGRQALDDLVGVGEAPAPQLDDLLGVLAQRLQGRFRGLAEAQDHAGAFEVGDLEHPVAQLAALAVGDAAAHVDLFEPQSLGERGQAVHDGVELVRPQVDGRPDVEQNPVPLQPLGGGAAGLEAADAGERLHEHVLELGKLGDPAAGIRGGTHGRQVAHLGHGEEALVAGVLQRHAVEEIDPLGRGQAVEMEVLEAPELQAQGQHGVDAAVDPFFLEGVAPFAIAAEGEALVAARSGGHHRHAAQVRWAGRGRPGGPRCRRQSRPRRSGGSGRQK